MGTKINNILNEGGAAGPMRHPFAIPGINTGRDLLNFFETAAKFVLKNPDQISNGNSSSIKFDGINTSIKLVDGPGGKEFAIDRGSVQGSGGQLDIEGITVDKLSARFPEGHGMIAAGKIILGIFNRALPKLKKELIALEMWDDPTKFLNTEFVWSKTNVVKYPEDFIAIHGVSQFYEKDFRGNYRPGLVRPTDPETKKPVKAKSTEIEYDSASLDLLKNKVQKSAKDFNFNVYTVVPTRPKEGTAGIDFGPALSQNIAIKFQEREVAKSLGDWLNDSNMINPNKQMVTLSDGRKITALSKLIFQSVLGGMPLSELLMEPSDAQLAVNGAIFYHATQALGDVLLSALTSPIGDLSGGETNHEGIVLRNAKLFGNRPVKITGDFITRGQDSPFRKEKLKEEEEIDAMVDQDVDNPNIKRKIAIFPGKFKPPQRGHLDSVKTMINEKKVDKVIVFISPIPLKVGDKQIGVIESKKIWELYLDASGIGDKVTVMQSPLNSPVQTNFEILTGDVPAFVPEAGDLIIPVASDKPDDRGKPDYQRFLNFHKWQPKPPKAIVPGVMVANIMNWYIECTVDECGTINARDFRESLVDGSDISRYLPDDVDESDVRNVLGFPSDETKAEEYVNEGFFYKEILNLVNEELVAEGEWQPISKKRTSRGHKRILDTGRKDLTKYGKPFDQPRPVDNSNAFVAKESIEINEGIKEKLLAGLIMLSPVVASANNMMASPDAATLIKKSVQTLSDKEVNDFYRKAVKATQELEKTNMKNKKPLESTFRELLKKYKVKFNSKGVNVSKTFELPEASLAGSVEGTAGGFIGFDAEKENEKHKNDTKRN